MAVLVVYFIQVEMDLDKALVYMPIPLLVTGFGMQTAFLICYTATFEKFELEDRLSALKWCNIVARSLTIFSPLAAELPNPAPIQIIMVFLIIAISFVYFLK